MYLEQVKGYIDRSCKYSDFSLDNSIKDLMNDMFRVKEHDELNIMGKGALLYQAQSKGLFSDVKQAYIVSAYNTAIAEMYGEMETDFDDNTTVGTLISHLCSLRAMYKRSRNGDASAYAKRLLNSIYGYMRQWHKIPSRAMLQADMRRYCHKRLSEVVLQVQSQGGVVLIIDTDTVYFDQCGYDIVLNVNNVVTENVNGQMILGDVPKRFVIMEKGRTSGVPIPPLAHLNNLKAAAQKYIEEA